MVIFWVKMKIFLFSLFSLFLHFLLLEVVVSVHLLHFVQYWLRIARDFALRGLGWVYAVWAKSGWIDDCLVADAFMEQEVLLRHPFGAVRAGYFVEHLGFGSFGSDHFLEDSGCFGSLLCLY